MKEKFPNILELTAHLPETYEKFSSFVFILKNSQQPLRKTKSREKFSIIPSLNQANAALRLVKYTNTKRQPAALGVGLDAQNTESTTEHGGSKKENKKN